MPDRYFIFMYPDDRRMIAYLNAAIYALNPREKWPAHITVGGPFPDRRSIKIREHFLADVHCLGVGNFFKFGGATVYLRVGFLHQEKVWKKPDFKGQPIPHLTLYDGDNMQFARKVLDMASSTNPYFMFHVSKLSIVKSISGQSSSDLIHGIDNKEMMELGIDSFRSLDILSDDGRLDFAKRALTLAVKLGSSKNSIAVN